jgi:hypothetical protein
MLSREELFYMFDMLNGAIITDDEFSNNRLAGFLSHYVEEADRWDSLGEKWQVDPDKLVKKIMSLPYPTLKKVVTSIVLFWEKNEGDLNKAVNEILAILKEGD